MFDETLATYEKEKEERLRRLLELVGEDPRDLYLNLKGKNQLEGNSITNFFGVGQDAKKKEVRNVENSIWWQNKVKKPAPHQSHLET